MSNLAFDEMLNKITSDKELMAKISQVVKNNEGGEIKDTLPDVLSLITSSESTEDKKNDDAEKSSEKAEKESSVTDNATKSSKDLTSLIGSLGNQISNSSQLLLAIKPYLNKNRQEMIDTMVKLSSLAKVINLGR